MKFSFFTGFYSNQPQLCEVANWDEFCSYMQAISEVTGYKPEAGDYERTQGLISGAIYANDTDKRSNDNVTGWDILVLDIDDTPKSLEFIMEKYKPFNYIMYSSASCTYNKLKLRVIIPLNATAPADKLDQLWYAAQMHSDGLVDEQTKDKSRMQYIPARYTNKGDDYRHFFHINVGMDLPWEKIIAKYPSQPPEERFKKSNPLRNLKRKIFMDNNSLPVFDIQSTDCPFVYDHMIQEYALTPAGGHHLAIYRFMVKCCYNAQKINYPITVDELADMGTQIDDMDGGFYDEKKMLGNAVDAMSYVGV
jgi:hypothetical protein